MGRFFKTAKLTLSWKTPSSVAASPKKTTTTFASPLIDVPKAAPTAIEMVLPRIGVAPRNPEDGSVRCIDPPLPPEHPVAFPYNSASMALRSPPFAK